MYTLPLPEGVYAHGLSLDPREINSGTCHWGKPKCSKKSCGIADRNPARAVGENDLFAGLDGPFDGEVATRFEAKNTCCLQESRLQLCQQPLRFQ